MVRLNLASRPFYNERLASFLIAVTAAVGLAVAAFAVQQVLSLSADRTRLRSGIAADDAAAAAADREAVAVQHAIDARALKGLAVSTQLANSLIDERTFSWTTFFGLIEQTLPYDVRVAAVAPSFDKTGVVVIMTVMAKRPEELASFIERLQATGAFYDVLPRQEDPEEDGSRKTILQARYLPPKPAAAAPAAVKAGATAAPLGTSAGDAKAGAAASAAPKAPAPAATKAAPAPTGKKGGGR